MIGRRRDARTRHVDNGRVKLSNAAENATKLCPSLVQLAEYSGLRSEQGFSAISPLVALRH